jgi:hemerythrin-like domain-containing protein
MPHLPAHMTTNMTNPPYDGATPEQLRAPLVRELLGIHNMFRQQLAAILQYVDELIAGRPLDDPATATHIQAIIQAGVRYTQMLHHHHHLETSYVFPSLQKEGLDDSVVNRLNADHDEIAVLIDNFSQAVRNLVTVEPAVLDTDLRRLSDALHAHLAYEETHVCPLLARFSYWPL